MLRAGLAGRDGAVRWLAPESSDEERAEHMAGVFEPGAMTGGPRAYEEYQRRVRQLDETSCNEVGRMLWMANIRSVAYRYNEPIDAGDLPGPVDLNLAETFHTGAVIFGQQYSPVEILLAIEGYEYQSCEHPSWSTSEAQAFCDALRKHVISRLPGYDAAHSWEITR